MEITVKKMIDKANELLKDSQEKLEGAVGLSKVYRLQGRIDALKNIIDSPEQIKELDRIEANEESEAQE